MPSSSGSLTQTIQSHKFMLYINEDIKPVVETIMGEAHMKNFLWMKRKGKLNIQRNVDRILFTAPDMVHVITPPLFRNVEHTTEIF